MTNSNELRGVINIYKEPGYTSHDVVAIVRKIVGTKKVGHTGTLDPNAEGVLPVCIGRVTKFADYLAAENKTYVADLILGITTDTGDISGNVLTRCKTGLDFDKGVVEKATLSFLGEYLQTPPMYSAIKIGGKKLYELARKGVTVERKPRPVVIHDIQITGALPDGYRLEVSCSKGTYIRSLCEDIGAMLGCGATMGRLLRTRSGQFDIGTATKLEDVKIATENGRLAELCLPIEQILPYPTCRVKPSGVAWAVNGNPLPMDLIEGDFSGGNGINHDKCWLWGDGRIIGLFAKASEKLCPEVML